MTWLVVAVAAAAAIFASTAMATDAVADNPQVIKLDIPAPKDSAGGIIVADADGDGKPDFLVTTPGHLAVYANDGPDPRPDAKGLWSDRNYRRLKHCHNYYSP